MRRIAREILNKIGYDIKRIPPKAEELERIYVNGGRVPLDIGYSEAKAKFIFNIIFDPNILEVFKNSGSLPKYFGVGFDERCIEYPWIIGSLSTSAGCILDAGSILNHDYILSHPKFENKKLHILTLAPEDVCFWHKNISYLFEDMRHIPIQNDYYDDVICLSSLEHVGFESKVSKQIGTFCENRPEEFIVAVKELRRVLKPGGSLFLSVPFGAYRNFNVFQQFDKTLLSIAVEAFGEAGQITETFYRYTEQGWVLSNADECAECEYVEWLASAWASGKWPETLPIEDDRAAGARSVACVRIVKV